MIPLHSRSSNGSNVRGILPFFFLVFTLLPSVVNSALPPLSGEALESEAEVVITGTVVASRVLIVRKPGSQMYLVRLQTELEKIEKGNELIRTPPVIEVRCWRIRKSNGDGPTGHGNIPADGSRFRMWLKKSSEGFWEPLQPNGIELLDHSPAMEFAATERRATTRSFLIGIVGSVLLIAAIAVYMFRRSRLPR